MKFSQYFECKQLLEGRGREEEGRGRRREEGERGGGGREGERGREAQRENLEKAPSDCSFL